MSSAGLSSSQPVVTLLNLVVKALDQLGHILKCFEAVPVADALHDLQPLLACTHFFKHLLAAFERCTLVFFASQDQDGDIDLAVVWRFGIYNHSAVRTIAGGVLTEEELTNESRCQRRGF